MDPVTSKNKWTTEIFDTVPIQASIANVPERLGFPTLDDGWQLNGSLAADCKGFSNYNRKYHLLWKIDIQLRQLPFNEQQVTPPSKT